jgi:phosphotriesterase-related protein
MTPSIMTVTGPVPVDRIGFTLPHEHLFIDLVRTFPAQLLQFDYQLLDEELVAREVEQFVEACAGTASLGQVRPCIVDVTVDDRMGRQPEALQRISERLDLPIVMGCGWYRQPWFHPEFGRISTRELTDLLTREIEDGVDGTGVRPGIIGEIGADADFVSPAEERALRAAGRAHLRTGLSITLHARASRVGLQQLDILQEEGIEACRVIVGHADTFPHPDFHEEVARRGAWVQFDNIRGRHRYVVERRLSFMREALRRGILDRVLLSGDVCALSHLNAYGGTGYDYIPGTFVHELSRVGFSQDQIEMLTTINPRNAISGSR